MDKLIRLLAAALVLMLVAAACTAETESAATGGDDTLSSGSPETTVAAMSEEDAGTEDGGTDAAAADESTPRAVSAGEPEVTAAVVQTIDSGRDIVFTAELTVAASDVGTATDEAIRTVQALGGFVFGQRTTADPAPQSVLTFKVFPEDFQEALRRLAEIGELRSQSVSADDVTDRIVDLQSRIITAEASVERLRAFLAEAESIEVVAQLESQLLARETELETLRGQLRTLEDQVALATIVLTLTEARVSPAIGLEVTAYPGHDGAGLSCPGTQSIQVEEGAPATLCFLVTNVGDTPLDELSLRDPVLDISLGDLVVVFGTTDEPLEPGESVMLAYELSPERDLRTQTTVSATPVDVEGNPLPEREVASTRSYFLDAADPGGVPTFTEGLEASLEALVTLGRILLLVGAVLLPFAWVPVLIWALWRLLGRRRAPVEQTETPEPEKETAGV